MNVSDNLFNGFEKAVVGNCKNIFGVTIASGMRCYNQTFALQVAQDEVLHCF